MDSETGQLSPKGVSGIVRNATSDRWIQAWGFDLTSDLTNQDGYSSSQLLVVRGWQV